MKALRTTLWLSVLTSLVACTEPQVPVPDGAGSSPGGVTSGAPSSGGAGAAEPVPGPATHGTASPTPGDPLGDAYMLTVLKTGGIAGMRMETIIDAAARQITYGGLRNQTPERRPITAEELSAITSAVQGSGYATFPGRIRPPKGAVISDAFAYTIILRTGTSEYRVSWEDETPVPAQYLTLYRAVDELRASKFESRTPNGAPTM